VLVQVKNKRERSSPVRPPGVEKTSTLRSRDPVASGFNCGPHGGMNSKMKSGTVSWLSLKTKVEPGLRESGVMSGDWRRLHRVRGVSGGSLENHWVHWLIHKAKTGEPKTELQQRQTGLTGGDRSDRCVTTQSGIFEAEDTRRDRMACVEATQGAVTGHPSDDEDIKNSKSALEGLVSLVSREGRFRHSVASI
jgi:hypothetical protein